LIFSKRTRVRVHITAWYDLPCSTSYAKMLDEREAVDVLYEAEINGIFAEKVGFLTHHLGIPPPQTRAREAPDYYERLLEWE
jgi:hypothetical protein